MLFILQYTNNLSKSLHSRQETSDKISIINTRNDSTQTFLDFNSNCDEYILLQKYNKTEDNSCKWA